MPLIPCATEQAHVEQCSSLANPTGGWGGHAPSAAIPACLSAAGLLVLRTVGNTSTFALATALAARTDSPHAAAHQICLQLWLASSLLADSLAVAAQTLLAKSVAGQVQAAHPSCGMLCRSHTCHWSVDAQTLFSADAKRQLQAVYLAHVSTLPSGYCKVFPLRRLDRLQHC